MITKIDSRLTHYVHVMPTYHVKIYLLTHSCFKIYELIQIK